MEIIDSHVHVWAADVKAYPLSPGYVSGQMKPPSFTPEELFAHCWPCGVTRIVLVQMSYYGTDNSYMLAVMRQYPGVFGGIAVLDENAADLEAQMEALATQGVRGLRIQPRQAPAGDWLAHPGYQRMFRCAAKTQQALCCLINPDALPALAKACAAYPDTSVVIDHLCRIGIDGHIRPEDVEALCEMARYPNVKIKVSAFYALGFKRPPHEELLPLILRVYEAFGPRRLMWGSDCPFQIISESYEDSLSLVRDRLPLASEEERQWLLFRTAAETFF